MHKSPAHSSHIMLLYAAFKMIAEVLVNMRLRRGAGGTLAHRSYRAPTRFRLRLHSLISEKGMILSEVSPLLNAYQS